MKIKELAFQVLQQEAESLIKIIHDVLESSGATTSQNSEECETEDLAQIDFRFREEAWEKIVAPLLSNPSFQEQLHRFRQEAKPIKEALNKNTSRGLDVSSQLFLVRYQMIEVAFFEKEWTCFDCSGFHSPYKFTEDHSWMQQSPLAKK